MTSNRAAVLLWQPLRVTRVVAIVATYNESRFIGGFIEHSVAHGVDVFVVDNDSTDDTVAIARSYEGAGLIGIDTLPRDGSFSLTAQLRRKEEIAASLDADWFIHADADERRLPPASDKTLAEALGRTFERGHNAVNFIEYVFVPTRESPDHDHADFEQTMRWYYPHRPAPVHRLNAWHSSAGPVDLVSSGGHLVAFDGIRPAPEPFSMRHYLFLSRAHAAAKYIGRGYAAEEVARGWHQAREQLRVEEIALLPQAELTRYVGDADLVSTSPRLTHPLFDPVARRLFPGGQAR